MDRNRQEVKRGEKDPDNSATLVFWPIYSGPPVPVFMGSTAPFSKTLFKFLSYGTL